MIKISPSILASNNRIESIKKLNNTNTDYIHIDTMDGFFVPRRGNFTLRVISESFFLLYCGDKSFHSFPIGGTSWRTQKPRT